MSAQHIENLSKELCSLDDLPALPHVALRILENIKNPDTSMHQLAEILAMDPPLSAKVLNVVNSPFFGLSRKITNLPHAVNLLGEESLKYIALSFSLINLFKKSQNRLDYSRFWRKSLICAVVSRLMAKQVLSGDAEDMYLLGLLHNIGMLVLAQSRPQQYAMVMEKTDSQDMLLHHAENEIFGCSHMEIGAFLLTEWGLPAGFAIPVSHHHYPDSLETSDSKYRDRTRILHLADEIFAFLYEDNSALQLALVKDLLEHYGMSETIKLEDLLNQAFHQIDPLLPFFELERDSSMDYLKILEESKKELFNLSFGLTRKVQKQEEHIGTLSRLAYRDGLTRLRNFQSFQEAMDREMAAIERYGHTSILAMVDLDHFKAVNDAHGHAAGDQVLRSVGRFFTENIRKSDVVARYGGEEFVLILSRTPEDKGFQILDRLCAQLAKMEVEYKGKKLSVTMSVGITRMSPDEPLPKSELLWQADQALYTAKHQGRNCCSIWGQA